MTEGLKLNPANKFGELSSTPDDNADNIVVRRYTEIGAVKGYGKIIVEAREGVILDARHIRYFVRLSAESPDEYPRHSHSIIQFEDIQKFTESLDRLRSASIDRIKFSFTEIEYNYEDTKIIVFNNANGKIMTSVQAGDIAINFPDVSALSQIKELILKAKSHIEMHRIDGS